MNRTIALQRLHMMGDWLKLQDFDSGQLMRELEVFSKDWKIYNPRKRNNRYGLSVTSLDGGLSGIPDLDSLYEYNKENSLQLENQSFKTFTKVYLQSEELQKILKPFNPWLGRCHLIRLDQGGFFPEHYDIGKMDFSKDEIRLIGFINRSDESVYKFCYDGKLINGLRDGQLYYFNANKRHSVFSMADGTIQLVVTLRFDEALFKELLEQYSCR